VVGIFVIPTIVAVLFAALPFLDRGTERRPWRRPWSVGACAALMIALVTLGVGSREQDRSDPAVARQLDAQRDAVRAFMAEAFEPQESAGSLRVANASLAAVANPLTVRGQKVFGEQSCDVCHGPDGHGSDSGPSLVGAAARHTEGALSRIIKMPTQKMSDSGMQPLDIPDDDLAALTAYISGLK
jgi:mono/diheme cytochrome c family protein